MLTIPKKWLNATFLSFTGFAMHGTVLNIRGCGPLSTLGFFHGLTNFKLLYHIKMKNI